MLSENQVAPRVVNAPLTMPDSANLPPNRVLSVVLEADEDVEWAWNTAPDGVSYVVGYKIIKK